MNYFQRRRYAVRYGNRRAAAFRWGLAAVLACALLAAFMYVRGHRRPGGAADFIITATATANEPAPVLSAGMLQMLRAAGTTRVSASAYVVAPGIAQADVIPLTPRLANGQVDYGPTRSSTLAANVAAVQQAVKRQAARGPFDLLATIAAAIKAAPPPATLIVVSSGLSTAGGLDLRQVGWDARPRSVAAQLKARRLLPALAGYQVVFSGLGDTTGRQPALPLPQQTTLASYWKAICRAAGAASCSMDEMTRPEPPSHSKIRVPVVPVPKVVPVRGPRGITITSLPDTLLFPFNSATLIPSADSILRPLARHARARHMLVSITGHASPDGGTNAYNIALSTRRAITVRNRLIALGLPEAQIIQVSGVGTAGQRPNACLVRGHPDEAICARLRRVVVVQAPMINR